MSPSKCDMVKSGTKSKSRVHLELALRNFRALFHRLRTVQFYFIEIWEIYSTIFHVERWSLTSSPPYVVGQHRMGTGNKTCYRDWRQKIGLSDTRLSQVETEDCSFFMAVGLPSTLGLSVLCESPPRIFGTRSPSIAVVGTSSSCTLSPNAVPSCSRLRWAVSG